MDGELLRQARDYALTGEGAGYITRHGKLVMSWGDTAQKFDLKSSSKSIGVTALALALDDGKLRLNDLATRHHPTFGVPPESNADTGWIDKITILHLATQTAGFAKPGGYEPLLFEPGTKWNYSDGGPNWLAECITLAYGRDIEDLMFERVLEPIGVRPADLHWRENAYRPHEINGIKRREFGSGVHANVDAMARIGYLYLRDGAWKGKQLVPADFVRMAARPQRWMIGLPEYQENTHGNASDHYGLLWWNNADGTLANVPKDAFWSWGLYDSLIVVVPSLDIVVSRAGKSWQRHEGDRHYDILKPFFDPIVASVKTDTKTDAKAPCPPSPVIASIDWTPSESIIRMAAGSDNWPATWGDDGWLYTAYGDGRGFDPKVPEKLSLGLARVKGNPPELHAENIRSASIEQRGDGSRGLKASGILMVEDTLYLWTRNADNARLAWSEDHGQTWHWANWKFTESFGTPTFLNFGKNYAGARDNYVYVYSPDSNSAYEPADTMVLARVAKEAILDQSAYEFFVKTDSQGNPVWSREISQRGTVFYHPGNCYRSGITYHPVLKRYLWCQTLPHSAHARGPRFQGGFGIYDAPEPWGPWTTAFYTQNWDVGPGETSSLPTKWMSDDGLKINLLFSGDDHFSVREGTLRLR